MIVENPAPVQVEKPLMRFCDMQDACRIVPASYGQIRRVLSVHRDEFPSLYRMADGGPGRHRRKVRILSSEDIRRIRGYVLKGKSALDKLRQMGEVI